LINFIFAWRYLFVLYVYLVFKIWVFVDIFYYMHIVKQVRIEFGGVRPPTTCWDLVWVSDSRHLLFVCTIKLLLIIEQWWIKVGLIYHV